MDKININVKSRFSNKKKKKQKKDKKKKKKKKGEVKWTSCQMGQPVWSVGL